MPTINIPTIERYYLKRDQFSIRSYFISQTNKSVSFFCLFADFKFIFIKWQRTFIMLQSTLDHLHFSNLQPVWFGSFWEILNWYYLSTRKYTLMSCNFGCGISTHLSKSLLKIDIFHVYDSNLTIFTENWHSSELDWLLCAANSLWMKVRLFPVCNSTLFLDKKSFSLLALISFSQIVSRDLQLQV